MSILRKNSGANGFTKLPDSRREIDKDAGPRDRAVGVNPDLDCWADHPNRAATRSMTPARHGSAVTQILIEIDVQEATAAIPGDSCRPSICRPEGS